MAETLLFEITLRRDGVTGPKTPHWKEGDGAVQKKGQWTQGTQGSGQGRPNARKFGTYLQEKEFSCPNPQGVRQNGSLGSQKKEGLDLVPKSGQWGQEIWGYGQDRPNSQKWGQGDVQILLFAISCRRNGLSGPKTPCWEEGS